MKKTGKAAKATVQVWQKKAPKSTQAVNRVVVDNSVDLPRDLDEYTNRIKEHHEGRTWKNPCILPPNFPNVVEIYDQVQPWPHRADNGDIVFKDHADFLPNTSPEEVLRGGSFGGHYFRPIHSGVTNITYKSEDVIASTVPP